MTVKRAVVVTKVVDVENFDCDHGCTQVVQFTNVLDDSTWEMCLVSFEKMVGHALHVIDCRARGVMERCASCPLG